MNHNKDIHFDLNDFEKIEDIIFLDEPILTHLRRNDKHYFQYLVDTLKNSDVYLLLEIKESVIFEYLTKLISLKEIITKNKNFCYVVEQDFEGRIIETKITQSKYINENYLPLTDSFLEYKPSNSSYYYKFIKDFQSKQYLASLRKKAFYLKFSPQNQKYADTIGLNELASDLLSNISSSFKSFLKADFFEQFKEIKNDNTKLKSIFNKILPNLDLRMVDLKYGSFEVGLAVDKLMKGEIDDKEIKKWAVNVGYKYKDRVLDEDYSKDSINRILENYAPEDRKKIYNPIFKITENPNYNLQVKNSKKENYNTIKIKDKSIIERIAPPTIILEKPEESKEYQIIQVTTVVDKNKTSNTIKLENTLFNSTNTTETVLENKDFSKYGYQLDFKVSIPLNITTEKDSIILQANFDNNEFDVEYHSDKIDDGLKKITQNIYEYILNQKE